MGRGFAARTLQESQDHKQGGRDVSVLFASGNYCIR